MDINHARGCSLLALAVIAGCTRAPAVVDDDSSFISLVVGADASGSAVPETRCDEAAARVEQILEMAGPTPVDVQVFASGNAASGMEPTVIIPWTRFAPAETRLYADHGADTRRKEWVRSLRKRCERALRPTDASPIVRMARRGAESLAAHCGSGDTCSRRILAIHSDFVESEDIPHRTRGEPASAIPKIELGDDIELVLCGRSQHLALGAAGGAALSPEEFWAQVFGRAIQIDPACPRLPLEVSP